MTSNPKTPRAARILVVEDEEHLAAGIAENLQAEGHEVETIGDGASALQTIRAGDFDLVVLDVMLPEIDGFTVCETLRAEGNEVAVLFLTARSEAADRIRGLEAGGDDYLPKPFRLRELLLRVAAILRRQSWYHEAARAEGLLTFGENRFNFRTFEGRSWDGKQQSLTPKEAMILKVLAAREGEVVSREEVLEKAWGYEIYPSSRTIDNFLVSLRRRFEPDPEHPRFFHTVRGVGYRFTKEQEP